MEQILAKMEKNIDILIEKGLDTFKESMENTPQSELYHAEGNVYIHTKMVLNALESMPEYKELDIDSQHILYVAAMLHDIGKIKTTVFKDNDWHSPNHSSTGSKMARELMYNEFEFYGNKELVEFRETVCLLIRHHSFPPHAIENNNNVLKLHKISSNGILLPKFSIKMLCLLSKADILGRISKDTNDMLYAVELCEELAKEENCYDSYYNFTSNYTKRAYLSGRDVPKDYELFDDTWGEVVMLSGLPGTGKDYFIKETFPDIPMISLDEIRKENKISPTDNQGKVANIARDMAKEYLRKHQPFVWNATNITPQTRESLVSLFEIYKAKVRIIYLETDYDRLINQNQNRKEMVPTIVICGMLKKLVPPTANEAENVEWVII